MQPIRHLLAITTIMGMLLQCNAAYADIFGPTPPLDEQPDNQQMETQQPGNQQEEEQQERQFLWNRNAFMAKKPPMPQHVRTDPYCFKQAEQRYAVSGELLKAISKVESNHQPYAINWNKNKSYDYCHMQINSSWAPTIGLEAWNQLSDPCYCTMVGAWILSQCIQSFGYTWEAVGCYNARTKSKAILYSKKVEKALNALRQAKQ